MSGKSRSRGVVYTPEYWADWAVAEYDIHKKWINGASVLDPGCGQGALLQAVIRRAVESGYNPGRKDLKRLKGVDTDTKAVRQCAENIEKQYGLSLPSECLCNTDFLLDPPDFKADIILGNPPWLTFGDLEEHRKVLYKPLFRSSGLTPNPRDLLLGGSRIDLAALFVVSALEKNLSDNGEAFFFLPLSLYQSEGAHQAFRKMLLPGGRSCALVEVRELDEGEPFPGAGTRYGFACYRMDAHQSWPIPWRQARPGREWKHFEARPVDGEGTPLLAVPVGSKPPRLPRIDVPEGTRPRQGANPGGAAEAFIIEEIGAEKDGLVSVVNRKGLEGILPSSMLHPLMTPANFSIEETRPVVRRWIFLPYSGEGKLLDADALKTYPEAKIWLEQHRKLLEGRRGTLMARWREKGLWWSMMGVGPYSFAPWKVAWEAYGRHHFTPKLFHAEETGHWQGNQALHAYLPFLCRESALNAFEALSDGEIGDYLRNLGGAGTKLWAQPGRIRRLLVSENQNL